MNRQTLIPLLVIALLCKIANGQSIAFHHLNTSHGLSDNNVTAVTTDHNGFLWLGTSDGLNLYDGRTLTRFYKSNTPQLAADYILGLLCDSRNRIWVGTQSGVTMIDEQRRFHRIVLADTLETYDSRVQVETRSYGVIILSNKGHFYFNEKKKTWELLKFSTDIILKELYTDGIPFNEDTLLICGSRRSVFMVDYRNRREIFKTNVPGVISACKLTDSTIFAATYKGNMVVINTRTKKIENELSTVKLVHGKPFSTNIGKVRRAADGTIVITSGFGGIYIYEPKSRQLRQYIHEPHNPLSLVANNTSKIHCEENGNVFITTVNAGVAFFNVKNYSANNLIAFKDAAGHVFDSYLNQISKDNDNNFWLAGYDRLIKWNPETDISDFFFFPYPIKNLGNRILEIKSVCADKDNNIWVGTNGGGIGLLDRKAKKFQVFDKGLLGDSILQSVYILYLLRDKKGDIWAATNNGVAKINPRTKKLDQLNDHPALRNLAGKRIHIIYIDKNENFWFGTFTNGVYCWNPENDSIKNYTTKDKLLSNHCYAFVQGRDGTIYIGSPKGLSVLNKDGNVENYNRTNGLRLDRCEGLMEDEKGNIWIGNDACLIAFDPVAKSFRYFDEKTGLSHYGFRTQSYLKDSDGTLYWGSEKGLSWFEPSKLLQLNTNPNPIIFKVSLKDSSRFITSQESLSLPYDNNNITFHFAAVNVFGSRNILYKYQLAGADKSWTTVMDQNEVRYSSLSPGEYTFRLQASADGINWASSPHSVGVTIISPWWLRWWFMAGCILLAGLVAYAWIKAREKNIKSQESQKTELQKLKTINYQYQLEIEQVINYFATSMSEQTNVDEMLWDVARNCISKLGFEDCVIYLKDGRRNVLVQKAAWGPKTTDFNKIVDPIEIPVGKGIVGTVAATAKAEIVGDTSLDKRYILDDVMRLSELAVPMVNDGQVIGVIDSEHPQKNFYTARHLQIVSTIASHCADRIEKMKAEQQVREREIELITLNRDLVTSQLTALRTQMNPHFIFNALNSVQQYILQGNTEQANKYLSKFSRLQREVLHHCDQNFIGLDKEIEMLQLYLQLEQLRFSENFEYNISMADGIDPNEIKIPPMMFQPFVENAIWHGLMPKANNRKVDVHFSLQTDDLLICTIRDNGIGRAAAARLKQVNGNITHKSKGLKLVFERLQILEQQYQQPFEATISDITNIDGEVEGTQVKLTLFIGH